MRTPWPACGSLWAGLAALAVGACAAEPGPPETSTEPDPYSLRLDAPERLVGIGDLHGDLSAARAAFRLAGAIDSLDRWVGGDLVIVQTGDILDRGDEEEATFRFLADLEEQAEAAGGDIHVLNGNHELMNAYLDYRYVTDGGWADFEDVTTVATVDSFLASLEPNQRARAQALRPGGEFARLLAENNTFLIVGTTLFTHGGVLPEHVDWGLDWMNGEIRSWLRDEIPQPDWIRGDLSPVWNRLYSDAPDRAACDTLVSVLDGLGVQRMVVGHTIQDAGITSYCGGRVWCIDVGMAAHYGGRPEVLEIRGDAVRGLR
ncbi:MAG: calcineurin [Gemmatimonadetes bacterium]|nr:calcineurin [Gemmatimonadota bacterium]